MTHDEFRSHYQLLKQVTTGPVRTYQTLADAGGVVMVHFLDENAPALLERARRLRNSDPAAIARIDTMDGCPLVVTPFIQNFASFEGWLDLRDPTPATGRDMGPDNQPAHAKSGAQPVSPAQPAPAPARPPQTHAAEPGEFTRMFGTAAAHAAPPPQEPPSPAEPPPPPPPPPAPAGTDEAEPGAFTRMFLRPQGTGDRQHPVTPPPSSAPSPPPADEGPGEFTRMFGHPAGGGQDQDRPRSETPADAALPQPQRVVPPPPVSQEGMTQVFRSRESAPSPDAAPRGADHRLPPTPPPPPPSVPHAAPPVTPGPGEFTRMFQAAPKPHEPELFRDPPRPRTSAPEPPSGPGQFTRFFQGGGSAGTPEERRGPSPAPSAPDRLGAEDDYFDRLAAVPAPSSAPPPPAPLQSFGEPAPTGPSPFTRMMQGGGGEPAPAPVPPPLNPAPAPAAKGPRPAALLALLAGVVLLTIAVIVLLVVL